MHPKTLISGPHRIRPALVATVLLSLIGGKSACGSPIEAPLETFFERYCYECHSATGGDQNNEFDLHGAVHNGVGLMGDPAVLEDVYWYTLDEDMPPRKADAQPSEGERSDAVARLKGMIDELADLTKDDPGRIVMARLSRGEYANAVRDLSGGKSIRVEDVLPADSGAGEGFSNVGEALNMSTTQLERYLRASARVLQHALVLPEEGLTWYPDPLTFRDTPGELREHFITELKEWHEGNAHDWHSHYVRGLERIHDMSLGIYWEAAWRLQHEVGAEATREDAERIASQYEGNVNPRVVLLWRDMLTTLIDETFRDKHGYLVEKLVRRWQELPAPGEESDKAMRERFGDLEHWYNATGDWKFRPDYEEEKRKRAWVHAQVGGSQEMTVRLDQGEKRPQTIQLLVTDGGDTPEGDVVRWSGGEFRMGEGKKASWKPWHEVLETLHADGGSEFSWNGNGSDSIEVSGEGKITVQAPEVVTFPVPDGATAFRVVAEIHPERGENATVQTLVLLDEDLSEEDRSLFVRNKSRPVWGRDASPAMERYEHAKSEFKFLTHRTIRVPDHEHPWYHYDVNALGNFTARTGLDIRFVGGPWRVAPVIPVGKNRVHLADAPILQTEMPEEELEKVRSIQTRLDQALQVPHQELRFFLVERGIENYPEGVLPPDSVVSGLSEKDQAAFDSLVAEITSLEEDWLETARTVVRDFATRAWRRVPSAEELDSLLSPYRHKRAAGGSYDASVKRSLQAVLVSPFFLFKSQTTRDSTEPYRLSAAEVADRLSFSLWASIPDERLVRLAREGDLLEEETLLSEMRRLLADERSRGLATEFAGTWFKFRDFQAEASPDTEKFPLYDDRLAEAMEEESIRFFADLFRNDGSIRNLFTADYKFIDERLAELYGIDDYKGKGWKKVEVPERLRGGLLTMASVLTKTSEPLRTSPVRRGTWLLEDVLGAEMPPPPPNVEPLSEDETNEDGHTIAEQLEAHREKAECAVCHDKIDPLGLALENFNPIGQWRESLSNGDAVTATATTADGVALEGFTSLRAYLVEHQLDRFLLQFNRKLLGYMLGRGVEVGDTALLERMQAALEENDYQVSAAIAEVVTSRQFLFRRDPAPDEFASVSDNSTPSESP